MSTTTLFVFGCAVFIATVTAAFLLGALQFEAWQARDDASDRAGDERRARE